MASHNNPSSDKYTLSNDFLANMEGRTPRNFQAIQNLHPTEKVLATFRLLVSGLPLPLTATDTTDSDEEMEIIFVADDEPPCEIETIPHNPKCSFEQDLVTVQSELKELQQELEQIERDLDANHQEANNILGRHIQDLYNNSTTTTKETRTVQCNTEYPPEHIILVK
jgi:hypothetical protein